MHSEIEEALRFCPNLPSLSGVALRVIEMGRNPNVDAGAVAAVLSKDPALAAKIIRIANSPLYAQRRKVTNLRQALAFLGLDGTMTLALSFSLAGSLSSSNALSADILERFWRRSLLSALACRALGEQMKLHSLEELFLAALLQDLGVLALGYALPNYAAMTERAENHDELVRLELEALGTDHASAGSWLMQQWGLPEYLLLAARGAHDPAQLELSAELRPFVGCVAVSGLLADIYLDQEPEAATRTAVAAAQQWLGLTQESLQPVLDRFMLALPEAEAIFEVSLLSPAQAVGITDQARELLAMRSFRLIQTANESQHRAQKLEQETNWLKDAAQRDPLTGLYNRRYFEKALQKEFYIATEERTPLSLGFLDLDRFKAINDTHGHQVGDGALIAAAEAIKEQVRAHDEVVRYGGEEFVVLLPGAQTAAALRVFERIRAAIESLGYRLKCGEALQFTVSIGVASYCGDEEFATPEDMIHAADRALYQAKRGGRNRVEMLEQVQ